jgi:DNA-binding winged helix-turn-helix (wHTH) protein
MPARAYRFGAFRLDIDKRELWRADACVSLQPKVFDTLAYLLEHRDAAVSRDELIGAVWGRADVTDNVLGQIIARARHAVDDTGEDQRAIRTVVRFGYRWVAAVEPIAEPAAAPAPVPAPAFPVWSALSSAAAAAPDALPLRRHLGQRCSRRSCARPAAIVVRPRTRRHLPDPPRMSVEEVWLRDWKSSSAARPRDIPSVTSCARVCGRAAWR